MPVHSFFKIGKQWIYDAWYAEGYPTRECILEETIPHPLVNWIDVEVPYTEEDYKEYDAYSLASSATEVFSLVLDCNSICDTRVFWEYVAFTVSYNKEEDKIKVWEKNEGLLRFYELVQNSISRLEYEEDIKT